MVKVKPRGCSPQTAASLNARHPAAVTRTVYGSQQ
jgi:hypothetical protein